MKNNIIGFAVYLLTAILFSPSVALILLSVKENSDRCHYYGGKWSYSDLAIGTLAILIGIILRFIFPQLLDIVK